MPRMGRVVLPEYPHHIVQRGHDRNVVFASEPDFRYYLETLVEFKEGLRVNVYAYCLMTNHVHLLLAPSDEKGLGLLMKRLAGRQTRYRNKLEGRSGTLWGGRYKSSLEAISVDVRRITGRRIERRGRGRPQKQSK
jgi:putative transposase